MIEVKQPINPIIPFENEYRIKKEKTESEIMLSDYYGSNDVEVHI